MDSQGKDGTRPTNGTERWQSPVVLNSSSLVEQCLAWNDHLESFKHGMIINKVFYFHFHSNLSPVVLNTPGLE